jgi:MFS family permease
VTQNEGPLSNRSAVRRLAAARLVSVAGSTGADIALAFMVYERTNSALWLSAMYLLTFGVTGLMSPIAGLLADRLNRRALMVASELLCACAFVGLIWVEDPRGLLAVGFLAAVCHSPFSPASAAAVPNLVREDDLSWANGLVSVSGNLGRMIGPALGGVLVASLGGDWVFAINAASFMVSACLIGTARGTYEETVRALPQRLGSGLTLGLRAIMGNPLLASILVASTTMWFALDIAVVADLPLAGLFNVGSVGYGLINAVFGVGSVVGAVLARRLTTRYEPLALLGATFGAGLAWVIVGVAPVFLVVLLGQLLAAGTDALGSVATDNIVQRSTLDRMRGRVFAAIIGAGYLANVAAFAVAGVIAQAVGARGVYLVGAAGASLAGLAIWGPVKTLRQQSLGLPKTTDLSREGSREST